MRFGRGHVIMRRLTLVSRNDAEKLSSAVTSDDAFGGQDFFERKKKKSSSAKKLSFAPKNSVYTLLIYSLNLI